jgi:hypothetical protein
MPRLPPLFCNKNFEYFSISPTPIAYTIQVLQLEQGTKFPIHLFFLARFTFSDTAGFSSIAVSSQV